LENSKKGIWALFGSCVCLARFQTFLVIAVVGLGVRLPFHFHVGMWQTCSVVGSPLRQGAHRWPLSVSLDRLRRFSFRDLSASSLSDPRDGIGCPANSNDWSPVVGRVVRTLKKNNNNRPNWRKGQIVNKRYKPRRHTPPVTLC